MNFHTGGVRTRERERVRNISTKGFSGESPGRKYRLVEFAARHTFTESCSSSLSALISRRLVGAPDDKLEWLIPRVNFSAAPRWSHDFSSLWNWVSCVKRSASKTIFNHHTRYERYPVITPVIPVDSRVHRVDRVVRGESANRKSSKELSRIGEDGKWWRYFLSK